MLCSCRKRACLSAPDRAARAELQCRSIQGASTSRFSAGVRNRHAAVMLGLRRYPRGAPDDYPGAVGPGCANRAGHDHMTALTPWRPLFCPSAFSRVAGPRLASQLALEFGDELFRSQRAADEFAATKRGGPLLLLTTIRSPCLGKCSKLYVPQPLPPRSPTIQETVDE